ncbi:MAG: hypothetical protein GY756_00290 [bacterium]|nr:hypothetical protein [bacterium]
MKRKLLILTIIITALSCKKYDFSNYIEGNTFTYDSSIYVFNSFADLKNKYKNFNELEVIILYNIPSDFSFEGIKKFSKLTSLSLFNVPLGLDMRNIEESQSINSISINGIIGNHIDYAKIKTLNYLEITPITKLSDLDFFDSISELQILNIILNYDPQFVIKHDLIPRLSEFATHLDYGKKEITLVNILFEKYKDISNIVVFENNLRIKLINEHINLQQMLDLINPEDYSKVVSINVVNENKFDFSGISNFNNLQTMKLDLPNGYINIDSLKNITDFQFRSGLPDFKILSKFQKLTKLTLNLENLESFDILKNVIPKSLEFISFTYDGDKISYDDFSLFRNWLVENSNVTRSLMIISDVSKGEIDITGNDF